MNQLLFRSSLLILICVLTLNASAQNFNLVKDINTSKDGNPANYINNLYLGFGISSFFLAAPATPKYAVLNGITYFVADDGIHGPELWRSDNTAAGTYMVKDITSGSNDGNIQSLTVAGNKLYFTVATIVYESDGTAQGTFAVPGITYNGDQTTCLTPVGNMLYFFTAVSRLWKTDGSVAGTSLIIDFRLIYNYGKDFLGQLTNVNGTVYFTTGQDNIYGPELWKSDGTQVGTVLVKDIFPGIAGSRPCNLTAVNGKLCFSANDGAGIHLWTSDGTDAGTHAVANQSGAELKQDLQSPYIDITPFAVAQKIIYFKANTASKGFELYKYNTANPSAGVVLVKDIVPGIQGSNPANITVVDSTVFFSVTGTTGKQELWKSNGNSGSTLLVTSINATNTNVFSNFVAANGKLLFSCYTDNTGNELWSSDGSVAGTTIVKDIYPGNHSSTPMAITYAANGISLFSATDGNRGIELWKTDGTKTGTVLIKNINTITTANSNPVLTNTAYLNNNFYFSAYDPVYGNAPYKSNGTSTGTQLIKDIFPGSPFNASFFTNFKNSVYFAADSGGYVSIYKSDGTSAGTIKIFNTGEKNTTVQAIIAGNKNLFVFYYNATDTISELWTTDGTVQGSYKIQDVYTASVENHGYFGSATTVNNTIYFNGYDAIHGEELWKATPAVGSAKLVKDIFPGITGSSPFGLTAFKGKVYFQATDFSSSLTFIFSSNGTDIGTQKIYKGNAPIAQANNHIFFSGNDSATGSELYTSDGTTAGTKLLKDIYPGSNGSYPYYLTSADSIIYFSANDETHGNELWKSNGTKKGTVLVKDLYPGLNGTSPFNLTLAGNKLYFRGNDGTSYNALFVSDGKANGTHEIDDTGLNGVNITALAAGGNKLYISGTTYALGTELYAGSDTVFAPVINDVYRNVIDKQSFTATIIGNPVQDILKLSVNTTESHPVQIIVSDINGKQLAIKNENLNAGSNVFAFMIKNYSSGIYMVNLVANNKVVTTLKFVKQ